SVAGRSHPAPPRCARPSPRSCGRVPVRCWPAARGWPWRQRLWHYWCWAWPDSLAPAAPDEIPMPTLTYRDATEADIATIITRGHAGDARGKDTPPLDPATLTDPRYRAAFDAITADPNQRLIVAEQQGEIVGTLQITVIPGLSHF